MKSYTSAGEVKENPDGALSQTSLRVLRGSSRTLRYFLFSYKLSFLSTVNQNAPSPAPIMQRKLPQFFQYCSKPHWRPIHMKKMKAYILSGIVMLVLGSAYLTYTQPWQEEDSFNASYSLTTIEPHRFDYIKDKYTVARHWIRLGEPGSPNALSAFLYLPVTTDSTALQDVLPIKEWQEAHLAFTQRKAGPTIGSKAAAAQQRLAIGGKAPQQTMPLLLFGPGLGWLATDYSYLLASLASKGNIVVGISALPISRLVYYPDGKVEKIDKVIPDYTLMGDHLARGIEAILKYAEDPSSPIYGRVDKERVVAMGHSVSGASSLMAAAKQEKIRAVINLDGDVTGLFEEIRPTQPILYITTQPQGVDSENIGNWQEDRSERRRDLAFVNNASRSRSSIRIKIPGMYHSDFQDIAMMKDSIDNSYNRKNFGKISFARSTEIITSAIALFVENGFGKGEYWEVFAKEYGVGISK
ncbi:hypothetical protein KJS94_14530 [Flavihumibacter rivuli]|uniref:alpha/beta hydrolase n=1 Tax=Flavihumibacter rivuli TaxID=2838156 RepID=UPI001BDF4C75|nr:hypothetical protein [Flavihumibacter rivuli]ULQ55863.1 hypothetical protein KJS94_14530 [Flavihumibacter rivuli]